MIGGPHETPALVSVGYATGNVASAAEIHARLHPRLEEILGGGGGAGIETGTSCSATGLVAGIFAFAAGERDRCDHQNTEGSQPIFRRVH